LSFEAAQEAKCHENAAAFLAQFPDHPVVHGWLVTEIGDAPEFFRLVAHSVNRSPDGKLVDVTPLHEADRKAYRFVVHGGSDEQFDAIRLKFPEVLFPFLDCLALSQPRLIGQPHPLFGSKRLTEESRKVAARPGRWPSCTVLELK
jgi:hypothetical protein